MWCKQFRRQRPYWDTLIQGTRQKITHHPDVPVFHKNLRGIITERCDKTKWINKDSERYRYALLFFCFLELVQKALSWQSSNLFRAIRSVRTLALMDTLLESWLQEHRGPNLTVFYQNRFYLYFLFSFIPGSNNFQPSLCDNYI